MISKNYFLVDKRIQIGAIAIAIIFSIFVLTSPSDPIPLPGPNSNSESDFVTILATNLDKPRAIAVHENRIFVTEKDGYIRVIENEVLLDSQWGPNFSSKRLSKAPPLGPNCFKKRTKGLGTRRCCSGLGHRYKAKKPTVATLSVSLQTNTQK